MDDLLERALDAHGGFENWKAVERLTAELSLGGPFWAARGWAGIYEGQTVHMETRREWISFEPFTGPDRRSVLEVAPERVRIENGTGEPLEERLDPRGSFPLPFDATSTPWDAIQVAYFTSAAMWNYLSEPFVLARPDVEAHEIEPWQEDGATWRRLAVRFPASIANHNRDQVFYYDERFMQRRMDYSPDVTGNPPIAHYTDAPKSFDGFVFPTRRRVHLHGADGVANREFAAITIDIESIRVEG